MNEEDVRMNPMGPHWYVDDYREFPEKLRDSVHDRMSQRLAEMNVDHGWEINIFHVKGHVPVTTVKWDGEDADDFTIEDFDVSMDWYSREQLWTLEP